MIIKTRKLPPTQTEPARMRASAQHTTAVLTVSYPHGVTDPHQYVATLLAKAFGFGRVEKVLAYNQFQTWDHEDEQEES